MESIDNLILRINCGQHPAFVELYGSDAAVLAMQSRRYLQMLEQLKSLYGASEAAVFSAPGRTEIGGNHTDHNHGRVLAGAVSLDNIAAAAASGSAVVRISSSGYPAFEVDLQTAEPVGKEKFTSAALVRGICSRLRELGYATGGFDACIDGAVPKGSGLSSSACFEMLTGTIISHLFNGGAIDPLQIALAGQYAENNYFGKPCGLMDQTTCAVGGLVTIDFKDPTSPVVKKVDFDFASTGYALVITDTGGSHADLVPEYASLPSDMKAVAHELGATVLREVSLQQILDAAPSIRSKVGDRAILRAMHFQGDNQRVADQVAALERNDFSTFLRLVIESGQSSYMYNQNIFPASDVREQGVSLALALSEMVLKERGAWRVHGGGFAGTIQAFVPRDLLSKYIDALEHMFGRGSCHVLSVRPQGTVTLAV